MPSGDPSQAVQLATGAPDTSGGAPVSSGGVQQAHFMVNGAGYAPATGMGRVPSDEHVQVNGAWFAPVQNAQP